MSIGRGRIGLNQLGWLGCGVALVALLGLDHPTSVPQVVDAHKFVLRDANGKVRAEFGFEAGGPCLTLLDEDGKCRARLAVSADGSSQLIFQDRDGHRKARLNVPATGEPQLHFEKGNDQPRAATGSVGKASAPQTRSKLSEERHQATQALYRQLCVGCHAGDGRGRKSRSGPNIPDFSNSDWQKDHSDARLLAGILNGRGEGMPSFSDRVSVPETRDLVVFIRAFGPNISQTMESSVDDFDKRLRALQRQWDELDRQIKALSAPPTRTSEDTK